jgi:hypothetical protein
MAKSSGSCITATEFYNNLINRVTIKFSPKPRLNVLWPHFDLDLHKKVLYNCHGSSFGHFGFGHLALWPKAACPEFTVRRETSVQG